MRGSPCGGLVLAATLFVFACSAAAAGSAEVVSTMRNVNAVPEASGFRINPAYDAGAEAGPDDLASPQAFEIIRPDGKPVTIGRIYTSCSCVQLIAPKRSFEADERAILQLHNIRPTPPNGQVYAIYVQITRPIRTTLRFDTFFQSNLVPTEEQAAEDAAAALDMAIDDETASAEPESDAPASAAAGIELIEMTSATDATEVAAKVIAEVREESGREAGNEDGEPSAAAEGEQEADEPALAGEADGAIDAMKEALTEEAEIVAEEIETAGDILSEKTDEAVRAAAPVVEAAGTAAGGVVPAPEPERDEAASGIAAPGPGASALESFGSSLDDEWATGGGADIAAAARGSIADSAATARGALSGDFASAAPAPAAASPAGADSQKPVQAISLITLGVRDMPRSVAFYESLGWRRASRNKYDQTVFFQLEGQVLVLYPMAELLKEQNMESARPGPGGITLALHVADKDDVETVYRRFMDAGGASLRQPTEMPSGAVTGYVADPDGNPWEISWVPQFKVDAEGGLWLP